MMFHRQDGSTPITDHPSLVDRAEGGPYAHPTQNRCFHMLTGCIAHFQYLLNSISSFLCRVVFAE